MGHTMHLSKANVDGQNLSNWNSSLGRLPDAYRGLGDLEGMKMDAAAQRVVEGDTVSPGSLTWTYC